MDITVVPIGKYKGQPLEVLFADQKYSEWLLAQAWFIDRYAELAQLLRMGRLAEPQDTPEHNAMVASLIDQRDGMEWLVATSYPGWDREGAEHFYAAQFTQELEPKGGDIAVSFASYWGLLVEVKPLIGDDYPSVIRQVKAAGRRGVVIANKVEPTNLTLEQVRRQFELSGVRLVLESEFFAAAAAWREERCTYLIRTISETETEIAKLMPQLAEVGALLQVEKDKSEWGYAPWTLQDRHNGLTKNIADLNERLTRLRAVA